MIRCKLRAFGRVQGVNYRFFVMQCARKLGVGGYVKNLDDDSVEIVAEARDSSQMEEFKRMISPKGEGGMMGPHVEELKTEKEETVEKPSYEGFQMDR